jgi:hypothetical protein
VLRVHSSGFRTQDERGTGCTGAQQRSVTSSCLAAYLQLPAPGSEGENVSALSTGGDACFFRQSQRQAYPLSYALSRSSGGLERSLPQDDACLGTPGGDQVI